MTEQTYKALDAWIDTHFDEEVRFLQELVRVPTDTPPGNNAPHAERTAELLARSLTPLPGNRPLVDALRKHAESVFGHAVPECGTPLYTDVRLYGEHGIPAAIYGAGPRTVLESNAKRADEHLVLDDLRGATKVVARTLYDLLH